MDPGTAKLAVELQLADASEILLELNAKEDAYAAFEAMKSAFQEILQILEGQVLAMNILEDDRASQVLFERLIREERQAIQDHNLARELAGLGPERPHFPGRGKSQHPALSLLDSQNSFPSYTDADSNDFIPTTLDDTQPSVFLEQSYGGTFKVVDEPKSNASGPSVQVPFKGKGKAKDMGAAHEHTTHIICAACMDRHARFDALELGCKREGDVTCHAYCRTCLIDLFKASLSDTTLFPPRCCGVRILLSTCVHLFPLDLINQYKDKEVELATPNPIYCSNRYCAQFIRPKDIMADVATCSSCNTGTCTTCKNPRHKGLCPEDPTVQMLMDVAREKKWQRCYKCRTMVELLVGCYHMQ